MSSLNIRRSKRIQPESIWNHCARKVMINIREADDVCTSKKSTFCKLYCGKLKFKTSVQKKTSNPQWNDLFFMEPMETDILKIKIYDCSKSFGKSSVIGEVVFGTVAAIKPEKLQTEWYDVKCPKKSILIGKLRVTIYLSTMLESKEMDSPYSKEFCYKDHLDDMQTGDLIAYDAPGIIAGTTKVITNSPYSHIGMVLRIPNKWTEERELFVMEIGRNNDGFLDAFFEIPKQGVLIHRLVERLHHFHGHEIWWVPRVTPFPEDIRENLEKNATEMHIKEDCFDYTLGGPVFQFLRNTFNFGRNKYSVCDLYGPYIIGSLLKSVDVLLKKDPKVLTPVDIVDLPCFKKPIIIRKNLGTDVAAISHKKMIYPTCKTIKLGESTRSDFSIADFSNSSFAPPSFDSPSVPVKRSGSMRRSQSVDLDAIAAAKALQEEKEQQEANVYGYQPEPLFQGEPRQYRSKTQNEPREFPTKQLPGPPPVIQQPANVLLPPGYSQIQLRKQGDDTDATVKL